MENRCYKIGNQELYVEFERDIDYLTRGVCDDCGKPFTLGYRITVWVRSIRDKEGRYLSEELLTWKQAAMYVRENLGEGDELCLSCKTERDDEDE